MLNEQWKELIDVLKEKTYNNKIVWKLFETNKFETVCGKSFIVVSFVGDSCVDISILDENRNKLSEASFYSMDDPPLLFEEAKKLVILIEISSGVSKRFNLIIKELKDK